MWCWKYNSDRHKIGNWITHYSVYPSQLVKSFFILDSESIGMIDDGITIIWVIWNKMSHVIHFWFEVPVNWQIRTDFGSNLSAKLRTKNLSRGLFYFVVSLFCQIQKCQCSKTIAFEATWKLHIHNTGTLIRFFVTVYWM